MDIETLYNLAKAAEKNAERTYASLGQQKDAFTRGIIRVPACVYDYNRLLPLVATIGGDDAEHLFEPIDADKFAGVADGSGTWAYRQTLQMTELALSCLSIMVAYLQSKLGSAARQVEALIDLIRVNLRPAMFDKPQRETDVQNILDIIFRARNLNYKREKVVIDYSSKQFKPDFTFDTLDLALEVKFCDSQPREKTIIDEINADIPAYQTKYRYVLFVVFDVGYIRDESLFKTGIQDNAGVHVLVEKM